LLRWLYENWMDFDDDDTDMIDRDPEKNFEELWKTFNERYPFFELRNVDWKKQYDTFRPKVTAKTSDEELFEILCQMLEPLNDGHVELEARIGGRKRRYTPEKKPKFYREFSERQIKQLFKITEDALLANDFARPAKTEAWMIRYSRSPTIGYMRILELEDVKKRTVEAAMDRIARDFKDLDGFIIDIRDCPGGDDCIAIAIINRFCDRKRVAFHRRTKIGPGKDDFRPLRTWHLEPEGYAQFTKPVVLLTCDSVFSGGEAFALAIKELPHVTIMGDHTNGIFSYTLDKELPNGWEYCLSHQVYLSADMVCYEGKGVPVDIELCNCKADIDSGTDPLIARALEVLKSKSAVA
jgi:C-terminal processing protease CtpA/Prc